MRAIKDGAAFFGILVVLVGLTFGVFALIPDSTFASCDTLVRDLKVFEACYPQIGCMATFSETIELNNRVQACAVELSNASAFR
jgi:hypothetical protein